MEKVKIKINDQEVEVEKGMTVIEAAKTIGVEIPHYCYHPGLSIAGNCRMCLVDIEKMPKPMIACNTFVSEGMEVKTETDNVLKMRQSVMEFLLINHPLDCPTCDQAGECRLQDYYMQHDEIPSRFKEEKVHKDKMVDLGNQVMLDQERCIACTRCIRFCQEVAGEDELTLAYRGDHVTITTFPDKDLSNPYSGNVVDICPVGALTNKDFRYQKRVWFLNKTESVCPGCSRGCNIEIHHADSKVYRLIPRENQDVNKYWMCDEGRSGYHPVNDKRVLRPLINQVESSYERALQQLVKTLKQKSNIAVVAHAAETNETLEALAAFAKQTLKTSMLYASRHDPEEASEDSILRTADKNPNQASVDQLGFKPLNEIAKADGVLVLNSLSDRDLNAVQKNKIPILAVWAQNENKAMEDAEVVLPAPSYAEQEGHFTNVSGRTQKIERAFEPRGEAITIVDSLKVLSQLMGN